MSLREDLILRVGRCLPGINTEYLFTPYEGNTPIWEGEHKPRTFSIRVASPRTVLVGGLGTRDLDLDYDIIITYENGNQWTDAIASDFVIIANELLSTQNGTKPAGLHYYLPDDEPAIEDGETSQHATLSVTARVTATE